MSKEGLPCHDTIIQDGKIYRFSPNGMGSKSGWYVCYEESAVFGSWKTDTKIHVNLNNNDGLSKYPTIKSDKKQEQERRDKEYEEHLMVANEATDIIAETTPATTVYLQKKGIIDFKVLVTNNDIIIVPMQDIYGKIWSIQKIFYNGRKSFLKGGRKKACFNILGDTDNIKHLYFCEGYATGISIHIATKSTVIVSFDIHNLQDVVHDYRQSFPEISFTIAADNDKYKEINIGLKLAKKTAEKYDCRVEIPYFTDESNKPTDFNDLHYLEGIEEVRKQLIRGVYE